MGSNTVNSAAAGSRVVKQTTVVTLGSGQNADAVHVNVEGAVGVSWSIKASDATFLTAAQPQILDFNDKQLTLATAAFPGSDNAIAGVSSAGVATGVDLSAAGNSRTVMLRPQVSNAPYAYGPLVGVKEAWLTLTRAVAGGTTDYTVQTTVYY